jgi:hypothetical protein
MLVGMKTQHTCIKSNCRIYVFYDVPECNGGVLLYRLFTIHGIYVLCISMQNSCELEAAALPLPAHRALRAARLRVKRGNTELVLQIIVII